MAAALRHRGPDGFGYAVGGGCGLVSTRLAIFDIVRGWQPLRTRPGGPVIVYNGEVYNHPELRAELLLDGIRCATLTDTEVVARLLERDGLAALHRFNGQFAFAWWEPEPRRLTLVRDRFGVRPLYFAVGPDGSLAFASEAKALFASGEVTPRPDIRGLDDTFTLWAPQPPTTMFEGVRQLEPGALLVWERGRIIAERTWWEPDLHREPDDAATEAELEALLRDSIRLRLRADVPVGTYLSGGLDSTLLTAMARDEVSHPLRTFSVAFRDARYDEGRHQARVAAEVGTDHHVVEVAGPEIAAAFEDVVVHAETPLVRTAPVPLYLLARETRANGITVVATGEGADEVFWGYDLFKEVALRRAALEDAAVLPRFAELYPHLGGTARRGPGWERFFLEAGSPDDPLFSHQTRIAATRGVKAFFSAELAAELGSEAAAARARARLPDSFDRLDPLQRAALLELRTLLEPYLLAAQADRVAMAHGVEGRYPFLDHRVFEHAARLPPERKLDGMTEKVALRDVARRVLPPALHARRKQPYRAPEVTPFFADSAGRWAEERLSPEALRATGVFDERKVAGLLRRCRAGAATNPREGMALVGLLSTQVLYDKFFAPSGTATIEERVPEVRIHMDGEVVAR